MYLLLFQIVFADRGEIISAGNFHGEYPAKALDYLAIGVHELAAMSERRIERLVNPAYSELPAFLVGEGGLNSGFMIAHCTAAALGKLVPIRGISILGEVRNVEISRVTQQLLCSKSHDFLAIFALAHSKINQIA